MLEEKKIKKSDFIITENHHTRLGEDVAKLLIEKINLNFNARYNYKNGKNYSYQIILQDNLQQLSNFITKKKKEEFDFVIPKIKLNRNDNLELGERTLVFDADLQMLVLNYPSEAQFNISKDITVVLVGYVSQEEIIAMANSFFNEN